MLGKGEEYAIADYAAAHWEQHKRPLRIAVDEACWRFNNLSDEQVARIREGEPAANPIEKVILWRILNFWKMNIQLLFVTDGMKKPGKKRWKKKTGGGRGGSKVDKEVIKMLHKMFDRLHVPYHEAPGEAEAECARLQELGVVDAVWSDDGDCLMFGCTTLIKAHRNAQKKKEWDRIQVYRAEAVLPKFDFDADSLIMFAIVAGGDYDDKGLPGCGHQKAKKLCQQHVGLARELRQCESKHEFAAWRSQLAATIREMDYGLSIPSDFPYLKALNGYRAPAVSSDDRCRNLRGLHVREGGWDWWESQMDQTKLRVVLRDHYNFKTREYLKHLAPVFLARALTRNVTPARRGENLVHGVVLRRTQNRKDENGEDIGQPSEVNIKLDPLHLVHINLAVQPPEEDWSSTVKNDGVQYDPTKPIDGVMLSCFLKHGLPDGALDKPVVSPTKRGGKSKSGNVLEKDDAGSSQAGPATSSQSPTARRLPRSSDPTSLDVGASQGELNNSQTKATKKRKARSELAESSSEPAKKSRKSKTAEKTPSPSPAPARFKRLSIPNLVVKKSADPVSKVIPARSLVINLDDDSDSDRLPVSTPVSANVATNHTKDTLHYLPKTSNAASYSVDHGHSSQATKAESRRSIGATPSSSLPSTGLLDDTFAAVAAQFGVHAEAPAPLSATLMVPPVSSFDRLALPSSSATEDLGMTATPSAATLRQRREAGLLSKLSQPSAAAGPVPKPPAPAPQHEVIDLT